MMGRMMPGDGIVKEFSDLDDGIYLTTIIGAEEKKHDDQRMYFQIQFQVLEPESRLGQIRTESFWIGTIADALKGTIDDPQALQEQTWANSIGASRFKKLCTKVGIGFDGQDLDMIFQNLINQPVMIELESTSDKKTGKIYSNVRKFHAPGERTPFVKTQDQSAAPIYTQVPVVADIGAQPVVQAAYVPQGVVPAIASTQAPADNGQAPPAAVPLYPGAPMTSAVPPAVPVVPGAAPTPPPFPPAR